MKKLLVSLCFLSSSFSIAFADGHLSIAPKGAEVYFIQPVDGQVVSSPFSVRFGL